MKELIDTKKIVEGEEEHNRQSHTKKRHHHGHSEDKVDNYRANVHDFENRHHHKPK